MTAPRLAFSGLVGGYGSTMILRGIGAEVNAGEVLFVLGRNGVGKSTLLNVLMGFLPCRAGAVALDGEDVTGLAPAELRARGVSYCPQERIVFDELSVQQNLLLMKPPEADARLPGLVELFPLLAERRNQRAGTLSGGEKKIVSFSRAALESHRLVLLDEPTEGVQSENVERMERVIRAQRGEGVAFVIVEQNLALAEHLADRWLVIDKGATALGGSGRLDRDAVLRHIHV
jgi:branched-chain amino acid transport system ATP-binding protein